MLKKGKDSAPAANNQKVAMSEYTQEKCDIIEVPAIKILHERGEFSASLGVLPPLWRPFVTKFLPWYAQGNKSVKDLAGMSIAAVSNRLANPTDRIDLLSRLQTGKDAEGRPMGPEELTAEAQSYLIAGSDTTSKLVLFIPFYFFNSRYINKKNILQPLIVRSV